MNKMICRSAIIQLGLAGNTRFDLGGFLFLKKMDISLPFFAHHYSLVSCKAPKKLSFVSVEKIGDDIFGS